MERDIGGQSFDLMASIDPERDAGGNVSQFWPQAAYLNSRQLPLNRNGEGPFCRFKILTNFVFEGIYAITISSEVVYVGKCKNLSVRFNDGYGSIHPRNCFQGGQSTNCRVNRLILESASRGRRINVWFHRSSDCDALERSLISELNPPWNRQLAIAMSVDGLSSRCVIAAKDDEGMPDLPSLEHVMRIFKLTLHNTYYSKGFFNVTVGFDKFVRSNEGPIDLVLGNSGRTIEGRLDRSANRNGTARIHGGAELRNWFQSRHGINDIIDVDLSLFDRITIG